MALRVTMSTLRTEAQQLSDKESDVSIATAEWNRIINRRYGELWAIVAQSGMRYFETTHTFTADGSSSYTEPSDLFEVVGVCRVVDTTAGTRSDLFEIMAQEQSAYSGITGDAIAYSLIDDQVTFYPKPSTGTYEMRYVPQPTDISSYGDSDVVDVVTPDGRNFLVWAVVVDALAKSESDVTLALQEREAARVRFQEECVLRALNNPRRRQVRVAPDDQNFYDGLTYRDEGGWWNR